MPYQVICPAGTSVTVLRAVGEMNDDDGKFRYYDHEAVLRARGEILDEADISPVVLDLFERGDPKNPNVQHVRSVLRKITPAQAKKLASKPNGGLDEDIEIEAPDDADPLAAQVTSRPQGQFGTGE